MPQQVAIADGRLYVEGVSPSRLLSFDLADPARPSLSELYTWQLRNGSLLGTTRGSLYVCLPQTDGALVFAPKPGLWPGRMRQITGSGVRLPARVAFGDHLYVLAGGRLAAYDVAGGV